MSYLVLVFFFILARHSRSYTKSFLAMARKHPHHACFVLWPYAHAYMPYTFIYILASYPEDFCNHVTISNCKTHLTPWPSSSFTQHTKFAFRSCLFIACVLLTNISFLVFHFRSLILNHLLYGSVIWFVWVLAVSYLAAVDSSCFTL